MAKTALLIIADGSEEVEAVVTADILVRAGINVTIAGLNGDEFVKCSRTIKIVPDHSLQSVVDNSYDVIILPGGLPGTQAFIKSELVGKLLKKQELESKLIAAICAAPLALKAHRVCLNKKLTSYPTFEQELKKDSTFIYQKDRVVIDKNLITSRGPGTSFEFALAIVEKLVGIDQVKQVSKSILLNNWI